MDHHRRLGAAPFHAPGATNPPSPSPAATGHFSSTAPYPAYPYPSYPSGAASSFGHAMLHREGVWACAVCDVTKLPQDPDLVHPYSASHPATYPTDTPYRRPPSPSKGSDHAHTAFGASGGFAGQGQGPQGQGSQGQGPQGQGPQAHWGVDEDPVDLVNSVLVLSAEDMFPSSAWTIQVGPACLHACLSACLSVCLPAYLPAYLSACLHVCLPACMLVCLSACLPPTHASTLPSTPCSPAPALCATPSAAPAAPADAPTATKVPPRPRPPAVHNRSSPPH